MKSRFDLLASPGERRGLAVFRASSATVLVVSLLALAVLQPADQTEGTPRGNLFSMEAGAPPSTQAGAPANEGGATAAPAAAKPAAPSGGSDDDFRFPPNYTGEAGGY